MTQWRITSLKNIPHYLQTKGFHGNTDGNTVCAPQAHHFNCSYNICVIIMKSHLQFPVCYCSFQFWVYQPTPWQDYSLLELPTSCSGKLPRLMKHVAKIYCYVYSPMIKYVWLQWQYKLAQYLWLCCFLMQDGFSAYSFLPNESQLAIR